jgi:putative transposase
MLKKSHGGKRRGAGRPRVHSKGVAHRSREYVSTKNPLHINFKVVKGIPNLRNKAILKILKRAIINSRRFNITILHWSLQSNHVHLIVEAPNNIVLTKGMKSLLITFAKRLNSYHKRKGPAQRARFHLHVLKTQYAIRNAINYVKRNYLDHLNRADVIKYKKLKMKMNRFVDFYSSFWNSNQYDFDVHVIT